MVFYTSEVMRDENVLNTLVYSFKNHMKENFTLALRRKKLLPKLEELRFHYTIIDGLFTWFNNLFYTARNPTGVPKKKSFRGFSNYKYKLLDTTYHRLLINLEQQTILNFHTRELVINQTLELPSEEISKNLIKWVTLMIIFN